MIAESADLAGEAAAQLPALREFANLQAGERGVTEIVGKRFALYPQPSRTDAEWSAWWAEYFRSLADVPYASLEAGMAAWVDLPTSEFLPKPGQLRELAKTAPNPPAMAYSRALLASRKANEAWERTHRGPDLPNGVELVREMLASFRGAQLVREAQKPKRPTPTFRPGKTDQGGITPELRELVRRQRAEIQQ